MAIGTVDLERNVQSLELGDDILPVTHVYVNYGTSESGATLTKEAYVTPDTGRTVEFTLSTITDGTTVQTIADNLLSQYRTNDQHLSLTATGTEITPLAELGDAISVNENYTDLGVLTIDFSKAMYADVESQGIPEDDDFPYLSNITNQTEREFATLKASITVNAGAISAEVTARQNADTALQTAVNGKVAYTELSTKIDEYVDTSTGTAKIVSACSGTYLTQTDASSTYTTITRTASLETAVSADEAKIALVVTSSNAVNSASIVTAINNSGSSVAINADKITMTGTTTFLSTSNYTSYCDEAGAASDAVSSLEDDLADGTTTINGGCITTGTVSANYVGAGTFDMGSGYGYVGRGSGNNGVSSTTGVVLSSYSSGSSSLTTGNYYFIATNSGVRMTGGNSYVYCVDSYVRLCGANGYDLVLHSNALTPASDQTLALGYSDCAFKTSYATNWSTVSDRTKKENIDYDVSAYRALFDKLKPCHFTYKNDTEGGLVNTGFIAQDIEEAMDEIGMEMSQFNCLRFDYDEETGIKSNYSLCYNDFICLLVDQIQQLKARVTQLETNTN